jgi:hypothetical protein
VSAAWNAVSVMPSGPKIRSLSTDTPYPQPRSSRKLKPGQTFARCSGVSWSRVISATVAGCSTGLPPRLSIRPNATTSSTVETKPPPPSGNAGGRDHCPSGASLTSSWPSRISYAVASRVVSAAWKAVSLIPSGVKTRSRRTVSNGAPAAREARTPSTWAPD